MDLGPHATFIWASYGAVTVIVTGLILWVTLDGWRQQRALRDLEARGVTRRSAPRDDKSGR